MATKNSKDSSFLQSTEWADFQKALGFKTFTFSGNNWSCLCIERHTRLGTYWLAPYGPTVQNSQTLADAVATIAKAARTRGVTWLRIEPRTPGNTPVVLPPRARPAPQNVSPQHSIINDLTLDESTMRQQIGSTNRNLVNRASRQGLTFRSSDDPADIDQFIAMLQVVGERTKARFHSPHYFRTQAKTLMPTKMMHLEFVDSPDGKPLAAVVLHYYGDLASYTYAASYPEARQYEAGTALAWHTILRAKAAGLKQLDFFGIAPEGAPKGHAWAGFTLFKRKFGGTPVAYAGTWDVPLSWRYHLYRLIYRLVFPLRRWLS